jgi:hypothetical protein
MRARIPCVSRTSRYGLSALLSPLALVSCASAALTVAPETAFTLRVGQLATLSETHISLRVDSVVGDSRCPIDVQCVWAGNAAVWLSMRADAEPGAPLSVNTTVDPRAASFRGRTITLMGLEPSARQGQRLTQDQYRVRLRFSQ